MPASGQVLFSVAEESYGSAVRELRDEFGDGLPVERVGPDVGLIASATPIVGDVAAACARRPLVFIRHLTGRVRQVPRDEATDMDAVGEAVAAVAGGRTGTELALQVWATGSAGLGYRSGELYQHLAADLSRRGLSVTRTGTPVVLSCCAAADGVHIGLNRARDSLSDWPGGRMRLARDEAQVSRAEFKLEELFQTFPLSLPAAGLAVDLGASPGGWTRVLRQRGMVVWAVDPGDLDPRVAGDAGVHHARTTAGEFFRGTDLRFDLAVNDMRMDPARSCEVMVDAAARLRPGALAVVTLKTGTQRAVETVRRSLGQLDPAYEVLHARQLHHNRHEVSVVLRRSR